jgi:hypothetical protein
MPLTTSVEQQLFVQSIRNAPASSSSAKLGLLKRDPDGRPEGRPGLPVGLYHPAFTQFQASLDDPSIDISSAQLSSSAQLLVASAEVYANEKSRFVAVKPLLEKLLLSEFIIVEVTDAKADGVITTSDSNRPVAFRALWELKNEIGCGGSDPVTQASYSYRKYWGAREVCGARFTDLLHPHARPLDLLEGSATLFLLLPKFYHRHRRPMDMHSRRSLCGKRCDRASDRLYLARSVPAA